MKKLPLLLASLLLLFSCSKTATILVDVNDESGSSIKNAEVMLFTETEAREFTKTGLYYEDQVVRTDSQGQAELEADLEYPSHYIFIWAYEYEEARLVIDSRDLEPKEVYKVEVELQSW